jgi:hypothetical protein
MSIELLDYINKNSKKSYTIQQMIDDKIAIQVCSREELQNLIDIRSSHGCIGCTVESWDTYVIKYNKKRYNGRMCLAFQRPGFLDFCDTGYYLNQGYTIVPYTSLVIIDSDKVVLI